ncbi:MAG TPA: DUF2877 domain-containing protein [Spirochaetia bacterium]|nr:DUF2877 domain-containing protein [Spirochaetia bacterium]
MPTVLASRRLVRAKSIGAAASFALIARGVTRSFRVHSVFDSTLNLDLKGADILIALTGPRGSAYPHAISLERDANFREWRICPGDGGVISDWALRIPARELVIDLSRARTSAVSVLAAVSDLGDAFHACETQLARHQTRKVCDLNISFLYEQACAGSPVSAALCRGAVEFGLAVVDFNSRTDAGKRATPELPHDAESHLRSAAARLVGCGGGLTPAGDDFLCGFLAALRSSPVPDGNGPRGGLDITLCDAIEQNIGSTGEVSASLLRCAMRSYWPRPLADLSAALAVEDGFAALRALDELCGLGHSSGADIATGFLYGLRLLARENDR